MTFNTKTGDKLTKIFVHDYMGKCSNGKFLLCTNVYNGDKSKIIFNHP